MPRLIRPLETKFEAIAALINNYMADLKFRAELSVIRQKHLDYLNRAFDNHNVDVHSQLLESYRNDLSALLKKWRLVVPSAVDILLYQELKSAQKNNEQQTLAMPPSEDIIGKGVIIDRDDPDRKMAKRIFPEVMPLKLYVSPWALVSLGREKTLQQIAVILQAYEEKMKERGFKERPSALRKHARWWFEHHAHGKSINEIAGQEVNGPAPPYFKTVETAIKRFSKIIESEEAPANISPVA